MMQLPAVLLMGAPGGGAAQGGNAWFTPLFFVSIFLVFWLFMVRPQQKKQKEQKKFLESMQKGEKIITLAGIHGTINKVNEDGTLQLEVSPGSYIKIEKSAISAEMTTALHKNLAGNADKK